MNVTTPKRAFISYAREDQDFVHFVVKLLRAGGAEVFLDVADIEFGEKWEEALENGMLKCERILVFWSATAKASEWVQQEWQLAIKLGKRIVPITLDETPLPDALSQFQGIPGLKNLLSPYPQEKLELEIAHAPASSPFSNVKLVLGMLALIGGMLTFSDSFFFMKWIVVLLVVIGIGSLLDFLRPRWEKRQKRKEEIERTGKWLVDLVFNRHKTMEFSHK
jgi:hypothetical protein